MNRNLISILLLTLVVLFPSCQTPPTVYGNLAEIASRRLTPILEEDAIIILDVAAGLELIGSEGRLNDEQVSLALNQLSGDVSSPEGLMLIADIVTAYNIAYEIAFPNGVIPEANSERWEEIKPVFQKLADGLRAGYEFHFPPE